MAFNSAPHSSATSNWRTFASISLVIHPNLTSPIPPAVWVFHRLCGNEHMLVITMNFMSSLFLDYCPNHLLSHPDLNICNVRQRDDIQVSVTTHQVERMHTHGLMMVKWLCSVLTRFLLMETEDTRCSIPWIQITPCSPSNPATKRCWLARPCMLRSLTISWRYAAAFRTVLMSMDCTFSLVYQ